MANELQFENASLTGSTLYVVVWNDAGQAWNGSAFATYTTTRGDFDVAATEIAGTGFWQATMVGSAGWRRWAFFLRAGGSPSHADDVKLLEGTGYWDGTRLVERAVDGAGAAIATNSDMATMLSRMSAARAGYLDNLNVGGPVASNADVLALNQSASRRVILTTVQQYERPESGSANFWIEARTYDKDGAAANATGTPTLTPTGNVTGDLSANLGAATNPATGLYRWVYNVETTDTLEQIRFDFAGTVDGDALTLGVFAQVCDFVAATFTTADRALLSSIEDAVEQEIPDLIEQQTTDLTGEIDAVGLDAAAAAASAATAATQSTAAAVSSASADGKGTTIINRIGTPQDTIAEDIQNIESGGGGGDLADLDNTEVVAARVSKLGSRRDGVCHAFPQQTFIRGEDGLCWIECEAVTGGRWLRDVSDGTFDDEAVVLTALRKNRTLIVLWFDTDVEPGEYTFHCRFSWAVGLELVAELVIEIRAPLVEEAT